MFWTEIEQKIYEILHERGDFSFPGGTIVLSRARMEQSRTIPLFRKKRLERVLKNIGTISKITERELLEKNG